jgi:hypothetical protein
MSLLNILMHALFDFPLNPMSLQLGFLKTSLACLALVKTHRKIMFNT